MPVVIALLNSYSGLAAAATGFVIDKPVLIITGSLVGDEQRRRQSAYRALLHNDGENAYPAGPTLLGWGANPQRMVQVPDDDSLWDPWHSAAKSVPIQGFIKSERNGQTEQQVVLGKRAIAVGETWTFTHRGARYTFRVDGIQEGQAYLSPVLEKESEATEASTKS